MMSPALCARVSRPRAGGRSTGLRVAASAALLLACCSEAKEGNPGNAANGVVGATAGQGGSGGAGNENDRANSAGTGGTSSAGASNAAGSGGSAPGGASAFAEMGVCGQRGDSPVTLDSFTGYEEFYLIGEDGFGEDICVVRFDVTRVGAGPDGCTDCAWTHQIEYRNPQVRTDQNGVCASSELGLDAAKIDEIDGSRASYGFVDEYSGHVSVLMKYDDATAAWVPNGNATWSEETGRLRFDRRDGFCGY